MLADIFLVLDSGYCFVIGLVKDQNVCQISIKAYISDSFSSNIFRKIGLSLSRETMDTHLVTAVAGCKNSGIFVVGNLFNIV